MPGQERIAGVSFAVNLSQKAIGDMQAAFCLYAGNALLVGKKRAARWVIYQGQKINVFDMDREKCGRCKLLGAMNTRTGPKDCCYYFCPPMALEDVECKHTIRLWNFS